MCRRGSEGNAEDLASGFSQRTSSEPKEEVDGPPAGSAKVPRRVRWWRANHAGVRPASACPATGPPRGPAAVTVLNWGQPASPPQSRPLDRLERSRSSDTDNDGVACESTPNAGGYVPNVQPVEPPQGCPADAETWRGLQICEEQPREGYDRDAFGSAYSSLEDDIIDMLPPTMKAGGQVYTPYSCLAFEMSNLPGEGGPGHGCRAADCLTSIRVEFLFTRSQDVQGLVRRQAGSHSASASSIMHST